MRKEAKGVLKSFPAPPRSLSNPFQLTEIFGEESHDLIGLSIVQRANHNGMGREEWHKVKAGYQDIGISGSGNQDIRASGLEIIVFSFPDNLMPGILHPDILVS